MPKSMRGESELEYAERQYEQSKAAWERFQANHADEPDEIARTSWPAIVADNEATLMLRRQGDLKSMVRTHVNAWVTTRKQFEQPPPDQAWSDQAVKEKADELGRKYEARDVTDDLFDYAVEWLAERPQPIGFEYLRDLREQMDDGKALSVPQAKGVLNCIVADARRNAPRPAPTMAGQGQPTPPTPEPSDRATLEPGIYVKLEGPNLEPAIFKVQAAVHGSNHLYAKRLHVPEGGGKGKFEYEQGAISKLRQEDRLSLEQAKEFGAIYGVCCVCGALLTDENSIAAGIGPVCAGKL